MSDYYYNYDYQMEYGDYHDNDYISDYQQDYTDYDNSRNITPHTEGVYSEDYWGHKLIETHIPLMTFALSLLLVQLAEVCKFHLFYYYFPKVYSAVLTLCDHTMKISKLAHFRERTHTAPKLEIWPGNEPQRHND